MVRQARRVVADRSVWGTNVVTTLRVADRLCLVQPGYSEFPVRGKSWGVSLLAGWIEQAQRARVLDAFRARVDLRFVDSVDEITAFLRSTVDDVDVVVLPAVDRQGSPGTIERVVREIAVERPRVALVAYCPPGARFSSDIRALTSADVRRFPSSPGSTTNHFSRHPDECAARLRGRLGDGAVASNRPATVTGCSRPSSRTRTGSSASRRSPPNWGCIARRCSIGASGQALLRRLSFLRGLDSRSSRITSRAPAAPSRR